MALEPSVEKTNGGLKHFYGQPKSKVREESRECHNQKPQPFPDIKRKQKQTNRTNVRKALTLALSPPSEVIAMLKGLKKAQE